MNARRHRRHWIVIGLLAALPVMAAVRLADRRKDPRFVGQWTVHNAAAAKTWPAPKIELRADGTGTWWSSNIRLNRIYSAYPLRWSTDRNRIIWRHEYGSLSDAVWGEFDRLLCRTSNRNSVAPHEVLIDVVSVSHAEIEVDCPAINNSQPRCILRRVE